MDANNFRNACCIISRKGWVAEANLSADPADCCDSRSAQRFGKGIQLRQAKTSTTTDVYMQDIPESVRRTVDSIHKDLR